jgi:hypothetical protein
MIAQPTVSGRDCLSVQFCYQLCYQTEARAAALGRPAQAQTSWEMGVSMPTNSPRSGPLEKHLF